MPVGKMVNKTKLNAIFFKLSKIILYYDQKLAPTAPYKTRVVSLVTSTAKQYRRVSAY